MGVIGDGGGDGEANGAGLATDAGGSGPNPDSRMDGMLALPISPRSRRLYPGTAPCRAGRRITMESCDPLVAAVS